MTMQILDGVRIIDAGSILAAPGASALLSDFGAEVIKVEPPVSGDPLRSYSPQKGDSSLTHKVTNRNKCSITLDLREEEGRKVFKDLVAVSDVAVLNFRMPTVRKWGIDYEDLKAVKSDLVYFHLTGFGRTGPYQDRPGFARVVEAFAGLTYTTGYPDRAPVPSGYAIADAVGGLFGAYSVAMALIHRNNTGEGQCIDLALYESLAKVLDGMYIGALETGVVPERSGTVNPTISPHDIYPMADGVYVSIPASTQSMFERLCAVLKFSHLLRDPRFIDNQSRVENRAALDDFIRPALAAMKSDVFLELAHGIGIAANAINDPLTFTQDPHVLARDYFPAVASNDGEPDVKMQNVVPRLSASPGEIRHAGERLGWSNDYVYGQVLGYSEEDVEHLQTAGII